MVINMVIDHESQESPNLNVQAVDLLFRTLDPKVEVHTFTVGWVRPWKLPNVLVGLAE